MFHKKYLHDLKGEHRIGVSPEHCYKITRLDDDDDQSLVNCMRLGLSSSCKLQTLSFLRHCR